MSKKEFWDIAHRGGEAYAPENTMAAFKLTMEYGIGWIETDVRRTKRQSACSTARRAGRPHYRWQRLGSRLLAGRTQESRRG